MHITTSALSRHPHISVKSSIRLLSEWRKGGRLPQASGLEQTGCGRGHRRSRSQAPTGHSAPWGAERRGRGAPVGAGRSGGKHKQGDGWRMGGNDVLPILPFIHSIKIPEYWHKVRHTYINEVRIFPHTIHKNQLKMAESLKYKTWHHKTPRREYTKNSL